MLWLSTHLHKVVVRMSIMCTFRPLNCPFFYKGTTVYKSPVWEKTYEKRPGTLGNCFAVKQSCQGSQTTSQTTNKHTSQMSECPLLKSLLSEKRDNLRVPNNISNYNFVQMGT